MTDDLEDLEQRFGAAVTQRGLWPTVPCADDSLSLAEWRADLTDPATAGALLSLLLAGAPEPRTYPGQTVGEHARRLALHAARTVDVTLGADACQVHGSWGSYGGATLGEAAARALLALWEAE